MTDNEFTKDVKKMNDYDLIDLHQAFLDNYNTDLTRAAYEEWIKRLDHYEELHQTTLLEG